MISNKDRMKRLSILLCITITISILFVIVVNATCPLCGGEDHTFKSDTGKTAYDWACSVYGGQIYDANDTSDFSLMNVLRFDVSNASFANLWNMGKTLYDSLSQLGILLVIVYCIAEIMDKSTSDNFNVEHLVKIFIKMVAGIAVILNGYEIVTVGINFATAVFDGLQNGLSENGDAINKCDEFIECNFFAGLIKMAYLFIPWLIMCIASMIISIIAWVRVLDVMIRLAFAPIGMADIMQGGLQSNGWKYFKKLVSSALQGAVILGILKAYGFVAVMISNNSTNAASGFGGCIMTIILSVVCVTVLLKSQSLSSDIMGA